jgi:hypothetical protein
VLLRLINDFKKKVLEFLLTLESRYHPSEEVIELGSHQLQSLFDSVGKGLVLS